MVGLKDLFKKIVHGTKVVGYSITASMALSEKKRKLKKALLSRFKSGQLDEIARRYDISLRGARRKEQKVSILARHLSFDQVVELARRYKVKHRDILREFDSYRAKLEAGKIKVKLEERLEEQINEVVTVLKEFRPEPVKDEEDLEKQVYQYLKAVFRGRELPIKRQAQVGNYRIDILIGLCGIELKVPKSVAQLQRLIGQLEDYTEHLDCVIALILDTGKLKELTTYIERLENIGIIPARNKRQAKTETSRKVKKENKKNKKEIKKERKEETITWRGATHLVAGGGVPRYGPGSRTVLNHRPRARPPYRGVSPRQAARLHFYEPLYPLKSFQCGDILRRWLKRPVLELL